MDGSGNLVVTLTDVGANGFVIADAVRVLSLEPQILDELDEAAVVDNGDPLYTCTDCTLWTGYGGWARCCTS